MGRSMETKCQGPAGVGNSNYIYDSLYCRLSVPHFKWSPERPKEKSCKSSDGLASKWDCYFAMCSSFDDDFQYFMWKQQKNVVLSAIGCFSLLVLVVLLVHLVTEGVRLTFVVPWIFIAALSFWLFLRLLISYESGQVVCKHISSVLFLFGSFAWFFDNSFYRPCARERWHNSPIEDLQYMDIFLVVSLPCLLSHALILSLKKYCFWFLLLPSVCFLGLLTKYHLTPEIPLLQGLCVFGVAFIFMFVTILIQHCGRYSDKQLYFTIKALEKSLYESKKMEEVKQQLDQTKPGYTTDKINQMRQFISYIFHEIRGNICTVNGFALHVFFVDNLNFFCHLSKCRDLRMIRIVCIFCSALQCCCTWYWPFACRKHF